MYDFNAEYKKLFDTPIAEIREDPFFRADNFCNEHWYGDLCIYTVLGMCSPEKADVVNLRKALKVLGYQTKAVNRPDGIYLVQDDFDLRKCIEKPHRNKDRER